MEFDAGIIDQDVHSAMEFSDRVDRGLDFTRLTQIGAKVLDRQVRILSTEISSCLVPTPCVAVQDEYTRAFSLEESGNPASYALTTAADQSNTAGKVVLRI